MTRMNRNPGLEAIYARLDEIRMSDADRHAARTALAQADALAALIFAIARGVQRLFGVRPAPLRPTSAHG